MRTNNIVKLLCAAMALVLFVLPSLLHCQPVESKYRGFSIDESHVQNLSTVEDVLMATKEQIDIVCAVGLPIDILVFFQSVPFILVQDDELPRGNPGFYGGKDRSVKVSTRILTAGHKPVLLHELLHAYHDRRLSQGFRNREIIGYFEHAKAMGIYAPKSHMMENEKEFFACAATTYLYGVTAQEPFVKDKVMNTQTRHL